MAFKNYLLPKWLWISAENRSGILFARKWPTDANSPRAQLKATTMIKIGFRFNILKRTCSNESRKKIGRLDIKADFIWETIKELLWSSREQSWHQKIGASWTLNHRGIIIGLLHFWNKFANENKWAKLCTAIWETKIHFQFNF